MNRRGSETQRVFRSDPRSRHQQLSNKSLLSVSASLRWVVFVWLALLAGCSVPNLEPQQCVEARDAVKQFYSFHFGADVKPSAVSLELKKRFLTRELADSLAGSVTSGTDYFTATENYPKAFRVGSCEAGGADRSTIQVVLFWRDDTKSEQKEVRVDVVKVDGRWLINKVSN